MTDRTRLVLEEFIKLTTEERSELVDQMNEFIDSKTLSEKQNSKGKVHKFINAVVLGPLGSKGPQCGVKLL
ncbi:MAG TPA: hypothetical protein GXZ47_10510 [Treponema sp.]|nr:hypothetical protein [Treponema sp.]HKM02227.1 hypothetical protein [Sedimentibacter sp.]